MSTLFEFSVVTVLLLYLFSCGGDDGESEASISTTTYKHVAC